MSNDSIKAINPPVGNSDKAKKYIDWLVKLIDADKLSVTQSDLARFNIETMQNHYRISLKDYEIEISHSKNPNSGEDMYVMLFNNLGNVTNECERVILSYLHLTVDQFMKFRKSADNQLRKKKEAEEAQIFDSVMAPIDSMLNGLESGQTTSIPQPATTPAIGVSDVTQTPTPQSNLTPNLVKPPLPEESAPTTQPTPSDGETTTPGVFTPDPSFSTPPTTVQPEPAPATLEQPATNQVNL